MCQQASGMFFAAQNFNRNVTVPWWETQILNADNHAVEETLRMLGDASFIVLNAEMYKVGFCRATESTRLTLYSSST
jgi:gluconolactonase